MPSRMPASWRSADCGAAAREFVGQDRGAEPAAGAVEHDDAGGAGKIGHEHFAGAHRGKDDAIDLAVERGLDRLHLAGRFAAGLEDEHDVLGLLGRFECAADEAAREARRRDIVGDERDRPALVGAERAGGDIGAIAELAGGGVDALVRLGGEPGVGTPGEDHRSGG